MHWRSTWHCKMSFDFEVDSRCLCWWCSEVSGEVHPWEHQQRVQLRISKYKDDIHFLVIMAIMMMMLITFMRRVNHSRNGDYVGCSRERCHVVGDDNPAWIQHGLHKPLISDYEACHKWMNSKQLRKLLWKYSQTRQVDASAFLNGSVFPIVT